MALHQSSDREFAPMQTDEEAADIVKEQNEHSTPEQILDGLLSKVGYGLFQKKLLVSMRERVVVLGVKELKYSLLLLQILCGFGWLADNVSNGDYLMFVFLCVFAYAFSFANVLVCLDVASSVYILCYQITFCYLLIINLTKSDNCYYSS